MVALDPVILFPDSQALVAGAIRAALQLRSDTATVASRVPMPRPERFVLVRRLGGMRRNVAVDEPTLGIEVWADDDDDAITLAQLVRGIALALPGADLDGTTVSDVTEVAGVQLLPDPTSDQPRAVFTISVALRGAKEVLTP